MINFMQRKNLFLLIGVITFTLSIGLILGLGLNPGIDFTGGTIIEVRSSECPPETCQFELKVAIEEKEVEVSSIYGIGEDGYQIKTKPIDQALWSEVKAHLVEKYSDLTEESFETIGPTLGRELVEKTTVAIIFAAVSLLIYMAWRFRDRLYGVTAVVAMLHDVLVILAAFAVFGRVWGVELDVMFVTAALTAIAFSVHDTVVLFDRVRELLRRNPRQDYEELVNLAINSTIVRSLSTALAITFVLTSILVLGGENIRWFVVALLIGTITGVYSSPFIAAPLAVKWQQRKSKRSKKTKAKAKR